MHFLSSRSNEPVKTYSDAADIPIQEKISKNGVLKRVTTLFNHRKGHSNVSPHATDGNAPVGFIRDTAAVYPRSSSGSSTGSPDEIRRPSGLGRRASLMESLQLPVEPEASNADGDLRTPANQSLPLELLETILSFLPRFDLPRIALVSAQFCEATRNVVYQILDFRTISESRVEKLCIILSTSVSLATRVRSLSCHSWPATISSEGHLTPSLDFTSALRNMSNLESLTIRSFAPVLSQWPPLPFQLKTLVILDDAIFSQQVTDHLLSFLRNQTSLQSLALPNAIEQPCSSDDSSHQGPVASGLAHETILPSLSQLHAPPQLMTRICSLLAHPLHTVVLDVTTTLYTGLRPAAVLRAIQGVSELDVVFTYEVDKRTIEKFLGAAGGILSESDGCNSRGLTVLEVEVLWMEDDTAEILYSIIDSIISRYNGLHTLKLTTPFRSRHTQISTPPSSVPFPLPIPSPIPTTPSTGLSSMLITSPVGGTVSNEFVSSGTEKAHAKAWTQACSTLSDIQFRFPDPSLDADTALCGVWFRRKK
ncbi:hypothetical protein K503DRAFT_452405 [Rhizopogon vinicolor AM-OR11-026]|uniref:F-box domain-containing protein n=1 Tax=Rhizopogon vinicolor AM-OR11-026 TaxID=1314800 RepID=A0A1B7NAK3_9AGAM|nr:hypothetical protein K503DRAFT_452405 [Rhizopogon vinicolor AM-OR11-026]